MVTASRWMTGKPNTTILRLSVTQNLTVNERNSESVTVNQHISKSVIMDERNSENVIVDELNSENVIVDGCNSVCFEEDFRAESSFLEEHISSVRLDITLYPLFVNRQYYFNYK
jgi:hypothetical protein